MRIFKQQDKNLPINLNKLSRPQRLKKQQENKLRYNNLCLVDSGEISNPRCYPANKFQGIIHLVCTQNFRKTNIFYPLIRTFLLNQPDKGRCIVVYVFCLFFKRYGLESSLRLIGKFLSCCLKIRKGEKFALFLILNLIKKSRPIQL